MKKSEFEDCLHWIYFTTNEFALVSYLYESEDAYYKQPSDWIV